MTLLDAVIQLASDAVDLAWACADDGAYEIAARMLDTIRPWQCADVHANNTYTSRAWQATEQAH
jgi:hypothetical protein